MIESASGIKTIAVVLIAVSMMAVMGVLVLDSMRISTAVLEYQTTSIVNETVTNASVMTLAHGLINSADFVLWNGSDESIDSVPTTNFTLVCATLNRNVDVDGVECNLTVQNDTLLTEEQWVLPTSFNVSYTYEAPFITKGGYVATTSGISALDTVGSFLPVVALVVIAGIIIVIVSRKFGQGGLI